MTNILFYGNCQVGAVKDILDNTIKGYNIETILCFMPDIISKDNFIKSIKNADIIITQPINVNYRNKDYLDTEFVLKNSNKDTKIIIFPSLHFSLYYFDMTYKILNDKSMLDVPSHYHYNKMIDVYVNNLGEDEYIEKYLDNIEYKSKDELENIASDSIKNLIEREKGMLDYQNIRDCHIISASDYIKQNYKKKLLFYSINHPSKYIFHNICENIITYLLEYYPIKNLINYDKDPLSNNERGLLYKSLKNILEFDIDLHKPRLVSYKLEENKTIVYKYFEIYKNKSLKNLL